MHAYPSCDIRRARSGLQGVPLQPPGRSIAALSSWIATAARLRTQGSKRVSGLSGYAHAANELLLHRLRFEEEQ